MRRLMWWYLDAVFGDCAWYRRRRGGVWIRVGDFDGYATWVEFWERL